MKQTVSVVISAWNEETKIVRALKSSLWADEIIVVDNTSTDQTASIAKKYGANVFSRLNNPMLNVNKNYGFEKATSTWIFSLDADEEIPSTLAQEIRVATQDMDIAGFWISRKNIIFGKWITHGLWWPDRQLRLFQKGKGQFPCKHVHEYVEIGGPTGILTEPFIHYNYDTISQFIRKMDSLYTPSEVANHRAAQYQFAWWDAIRFPLSDFVKIYFAQEGYKDGLHGLVLAILQAFYSFVVFAKLWEMEGFIDSDISLSALEKEGARGKKELSFWHETVRIREASSLLTKIGHKIRRKILSIRSL